MGFNTLFRKKSVQDILLQVEKNEADGHGSMGRHLGVRDLAAFGIAAIIGAGIFSTIGKASFDGGPAVIFLFIFTALACGFAAFAYAEFASMVPASGSAYTYSYVAFGEIIAWIIGWSLIMEYAIGNITVAISWSDYFTGLLESGGINLPQWIQMDYLSAHKGYDEAMSLINSGKLIENLDPSLKAAYSAWTESPSIGSLHFIADLPALLIIVLITWLVYRGMKESRNASNLMVVIKMAVILLVIAVGIFYVDTANWDPFAPNGVSGILKGVSAVFFAYIGFDAISTTAEECRDPQRDLPRGMMWAIIICTILYVLIALVLTGMVNYSEFEGVGDPLAFVFDKLNLKWLSGIIAVSAVVAMASVLLVFQMGQPRIWMSMSRDGLLPKKFSKIHPRFKTPSFATIVVGFVVAVPALFLNLTIVTDLCAIGTLFAFVCVCAGVLVLQNKTDIPRGKFKTPYVNSKYVTPFLLIGTLILLFTVYKEDTMAFITNERQVKSSSDLIVELNTKQTRDIRFQLENTNSEAFNKSEKDLDKYLGGLKNAAYVAELKSLGAPKYIVEKQEKSTSEVLAKLDKSQEENIRLKLEETKPEAFAKSGKDLSKYFVDLKDAAYLNELHALGLPDSMIYDSGFSLFKHKIPMWIFFIVTLGLVYWSVTKNLSLIPLLGLISCLYMMSELGLSNWIGFGLWLLVGLVVYFGYGRKHSKLNLIHTNKV